MSLEITTENGKVTELVDYINHNNPTEYDYPVPNVTVLPVADGNKAYLDWVKTNSGAGLKLNPWAVKWLEEPWFKKNEKDYMNLSRKPLYST